MAGTRWLLEVHLVSPGLVGDLKSTIGFDRPVNVSNDGPEAVVNFDYDTEAEARTAKRLAEDAFPGVRCIVEEFERPNRLTQDRGRAQEQ